MTLPFVFSTHAIVLIMPRAKLFRKRHSYGGRFCLHLTHGANLSIHAGLEGIKN